MTWLILHLLSCPVWLLKAPLYRKVVTELVLRDLSATLKDLLNAEINLPQTFLMNLFLNLLQRANDICIILQPWYPDTISYTDDCIMYQMYYLLCIICTMYHVSYVLCIMYRMYLCIMYHIYYVSNVLCIHVSMFYVLCVCTMYHILCIKCDMYSVMQSDGNSFCGDVVLDSFNISPMDDNSILDQNILGSL